MTDKERKKDRELRRVYGISLEQYNEMLKNQNDSCGICEKHYTKFNRALCVDHDHKTNKVRGLLCFYCNKYFVGRHRSDTVVKLVKYLLPEYELILKKDLQVGTNLDKIKKKRR